MNSRTREALLQMVIGIVLVLWAIAVLAFVLSMQADAAEIPAVLGSVVS